MHAGQEVRETDRSAREHGEGAFNNAGRDGFHFRLTHRKGGRWGVAGFVLVLRAGSWDRVVQEVVLVVFGKAIFGRCGNVGLVFGKEEGNGTQFFLLVESDENLA